MLSRTILHKNLECQVHESRQIGSVKQEMGRVNVDILGISEPKWTGMGEFNSDDHFNSDSMYSMILFVYVIHRKSLEG